MKSSAMKIVGLEDLSHSAAGASVEVQDLRFDPEDDNKACMKVVVTSADHELDFDLTFLMKDQPGEVETTLEEARMRLITLFESALWSLKSGPLARR